MRTLTIGDRSISYDVRMDSMEGMGGDELNHPVKPTEEDQHFSSTKSISQFEKQFLEHEESQHSAPYSDQDSGAGSECSEDQEDVETERKLIKPDMTAINQLLNFDEEEEDLTESETEEFDYETDNSKWQTAMVNDLLSLKTCDPLLKRRHSITKCDSANEKQRSFDSSPSSSLTAVPGVPSLEIGVATLNLSLSEVGHIRSVLARAELEASTLEETVLLDMEQGKICTVCTITRFGLFHRGQKCEVCRQTVCCKCVSRMRIPAEQFSAIPVQVLSTVSGSKDSSTSPTTLSYECVSDVYNCAGSAPNTPQNKRKDPIVPVSAKQLLHEQPNSLPSLSASHIPTLHPPLVTSKYSLLPKMTDRRWSMFHSSQKDREMMEGSLLTVCMTCNDMVKQVIRAGGVNRRSR